MKMKIFSDVSSLVIIVITLYVQFSHGLIEMNMEKEKHVRTIDVQAVEGKRVSLPCPLIPPTSDKVYMVLWFRDDAGIPLYSFDVRGKPLAQARHWSAPETFGSRAKFNTAKDPATLDLEDIKRHDQGVYRCRVDFRTSQTQSFRYNLTIIIPPEHPIVLNRWGRQLNGTILGPMEEGDDIMLTCRVVGVHSDDTQSPQNWNMHSDCNIWDNPRYNQPSDDSDNYWKQLNEDFNISCSLKPSIWSNNVPSNQQNNLSPNVERMNIARTSLSEPVIGTSKQNLNNGNEWHIVNAIANNAIANGNSMTKRLPVTSRNQIPPYSNSIQPAYGMGYKIRGVSSSLLPLPYQADSILMTHLAEESCEKFMQKLQVIVNNGFLNPKILTDPISPDTYELVNMLIYFVMEYSKTKRYTQENIQNAALDADISIIFHKINLIRSEIEKCQSKYIETKRIERETLQSFAERNNAATRPQTLNDLRNLRHGEVSMIRDLNNLHENHSSASIQPNQCSNLTLSNKAQYHRRLNQSKNQCRVDQAQQQNAVQNTSENHENRFNFNKENNNALRKESPI